VTAGTGPSSGNGSGRAAHAGDLETADTHTEAAHAADASAAVTTGGSTATLTKADFQSDQETRWCPGCGDYAVLSAVQQFMPELGIPPERIVFVTGIGCAGRFSYYMDTYGMHGIHGRGPALATGLASTREDLSIWVVTGDGDSLSIGGNHLIHALRRNVSVKILLFNNQIYGLTKGQASPTSELGKITKSTPFGVADHPFNPVALALGAEATFVARTIDRDRHHLTEVLSAAARHEGAALVEIYQNCPVFNDGAFAALTEKDVKDDNQIRLEHGKPVRFGPNGARGVARAASGGLEIIDVTEPATSELLIHDSHRSDPGLAFSLAKLAEDPTGPTPIGIFRDVERPVYGRSASAELKPASEQELQELLLAGDTWTVA
jgi:2-oxoglutarate ferredoxin oxidoreductase subunit beta